MLTPIIALIFIGLGIVLAFFGYGLFRILLPILGAISGFAIGADLATNFTSDRAGVLVIALVAAVLGALLAATLWQIAVILQVAYVAYLISLSIFQSTNLFNADAIQLAALFVAGLVALFAIVFRVWKLLVIFSTALNGAYLGVAGVVMLLGGLQAADLSWNLNLVRSFNSSVNLGAVVLGICVWAAAGILYQIQRYQHVDAN